MYQHYATGPAPGSDRASDGLRALVLILSIIKAIPLVIGLIGVIFLVGVSRELSDIDGLSVFEGAAIIGAIIFLAVIAVGALLLFLQIRSAFKNSMGTLAVVASIIAVIDLLGLLGSADDAGGLILMLAVFAGQATIAVWAIKLRNRSGV